MGPSMIRPENNDKHFWEGNWANSPDSKGFVSDCYSCQKRQKCLSATRFLPLSLFSGLFILGPQIPLINMSSTEMGKN